MKEVSFADAIRKKYPEPVAVAISFDKAHSRANIITLGWSMCTSGEPPMLAISVGHSRYSHQTIREQGEFVVAFPSEDQAKAALFCGSHSGRDNDKFKESGFKPLSATKVKAPLIDGACANFECKLVNSCESGDHTIFVGMVVSSHMSEENKARLYVVSGGNLKGIKA